MRHYTLPLAILLGAAILAHATPPLSRTPTIGSPSNNALGIRKTESKGLFGNGLRSLWSNSSTSTSKTGFRPWWQRSSGSATSASAQRPFLQRLFNPK